MNIDIGRVWHDAKDIHLWDGKVHSSVRLSDVKVIAEFVDPGGGFATEDYFLVLVESRTHGSFLPLSAGGFDEVVHFIETALGTKLERKLIGCIQHASRIIWPLSLRGQPLYVFTTMDRRHLPWWKRFLLRRREIEYRLTSEVETFLALGA